MSIQVETKDCTALGDAELAELAAVGVSNIAVGIFQGFPISSSSS